MKKIVLPAKIKINSDAEFQTALIFFAQLLDRRSREGTIIMIVHPVFLPMLKAMRGWIEEHPVASDHGAGVAVGIGADRLVPVDSRAFTKLLHRTIAVIEQSPTTHTSMQDVDALAEEIHGQIIGLRNLHLEMLRFIQGNKITSVAEFKRTLGQDDALAKLQQSVSQIIMLFRSLTFFGRQIDTVLFKHYRHLEKFQGDDDKYLQAILCIEPTDAVYRAKKTAGYIGYFVTYPVILLARALMGAGMLSVSTTVALVTALNAFTSTTVNDPNDFFSNETWNKFLMVFTILNAIEMGLNIFESGMTRQRALKRIVAESFFPWEILGPEIFLREEMPSPDPLFYQSAIGPLYGASAIGSLYFDIVAMVGGWNLYKMLTAWVSDGEAVANDKLSVWIYASSFLVTAITEFAFQVRPVPKNLQDALMQISQAGAEIRKNPTQWRRYAWAKTQAILASIGYLMLFLPAFQLGIETLGVPFAKWLHEKISLPTVTGRAVADTALGLILGNMFLMILLGQISLLYSCATKGHSIAPPAEIDSRSLKSSLRAMQYTSYVLIYGNVAFLTLITFGNATATIDRIINWLGDNLLGGNPPAWQITMRIANILFSALTALMTGKVITLFCEHEGFLATYALLQQLQSKFYGHAAALQSPDMRSIDVASVQHHVSELLGQNIAAIEDNLRALVLHSQDGAEQPFTVDVGGAAAAHSHQSCWASIWPRSKGLARIQPLNAVTPVENIQEQTGAGVALHP